MVSNEVMITNSDDSKMFIGDQKDDHFRFGTSQPKDIRLSEENDPRLVRNMTTANKSPNR